MCLALSFQCYINDVVRWVNTFALQLGNKSVVGAGPLQPASNDISKISVAIVVVSGSNLSSNHFASKVRIFSFGLAIMRQVSLAALWLEVFGVTRHVAEMGNENDPTRAWVTRPVPFNGLSFPATGTSATCGMGHQDHVSASMHFGSSTCVGMPALAWASEGK